MATKVTLRKKSISKNRESLYLDFYPAILDPETGEPTRRHFLGKFIFASIDEIKKKDKFGEIKKVIQVYDKDSVENARMETHNNQTLSLATEIKHQWERKLNANE